jgi:hypothetical protein
LISDLIFRRAVKSKRRRGPRRSSIFAPVNGRAGGEHLGHGLDRRLGAAPVML